MSIKRTTNGLIYDRPAYIILPDGHQYKISFNREPVAGETINLDRVRYIVVGVEWIEELGDIGIFTAHITVELDRSG